MNVEERNKLVCESVRTGRKIQWLNHKGDWVNEIKESPFYMTGNSNMDLYRLEPVKKTVPWMPEEMFMFRRKDGYIKDIPNSIGESVVWVGSNSYKLEDLADKCEWSPITDGKTWHPFTKEVEE